MNIENKKLISKSKLFEIMYEYLKPELDKCYSSGGDWDNFSIEGRFGWILTNLGDRNIGSCKRDNHWVIFNNHYYMEDDINIKIFNDHVEFIEGSTFIDFKRDFMYGLYLKIMEYVEGNNIKEENVMGVQNENNNEGSQFESAMNNYDGDVTKHRKSDEWDKMRAMVNGFHLPEKIDCDKINITNVEKSSKPYRPSKDHYYLNIAKEVAQRGTCLRRKFGAVIVNNDEIISTGYVGAPRGRVNCTDRGVCFRQENNVTPGTRYELCRSVHAEMNAVISAGRDRCIGATLYLVGIENDGSFTSNADCCSMCKRVIINAGIEKVVFRTPLGQRTIHVKEDWINDDSLTIHEGY